LIDYEILLLLDPELSEEQQEETIGRARDVIVKGGGSVDRHDVWGRRKLAYEIDKKGEAFYWMVRLTCPAPALAELERVLRITDEVLRHKAVKQSKARPVAAARS